MEQNIYPISFFDSYQKKDVVLSPENTVVPGVIKMYSCGPTVYSTQQIGNMRAAWFPDTFKSVAELAGWKVELVHNITDVGHLVGDGDYGEDKIEKGAKREGKTVEEIVNFYLNNYLDQAKQLNITLPSGKFRPKATEFIEQQMILALTLIKMGKAYILEDGIYFDHNANKSDIEQLEKFAGMSKSGGNNDFTGREIKNTDKNPADFALWKFVDESSLQKWKFDDYTSSDSSSFSQEIFNLIIDVKNSEEYRNDEFELKWGCPGWHSECVAMIFDILTNTKIHFNGGSKNFSEKPYLIDVHSGGEEHISMHHKNEILQTEALGYHLSKNWLHWKHVLIDGAKMSKSSGTTYTVFDLIEKGFDPLAYRLMLLEHHYNEQMNFTWEKLEQSQNRLFNIRKEIAKIRSFAQSPELESMNENKYLAVKNRWLEILTEDLNLPKFLEEYQEFLHTIVNRIQNQNILSIQDHKLLSEFDSKLLKLNLFELNLPEEILNLAEERWTAKKTKNYQKADEIRQEVLKEGWQIDDYAWGWGIWWKGLSK